MYLWTAVDVTGALEEIRQRALLANGEIGLSQVAFLLPAHVSLQISFQVAEENAADIQREMEQIFRRTPAFSIRVRGLEGVPGCLWIAMEENETLRGLHEKMVGLAGRYGAPPHPFDGDFRYHSTLFLSQEAEKLARMADRLKEAPLPDVIPANAFLIGGSETGRAGEYRVFQRIEARG